MNLDDAIGTIISRGFTERQARFLVLVARHSGVCVMRQYSAFAGVVFGHTIGSCTKPSAMPSPASGVRPRCHARSSASCCSTSS
jgi:hypothetical protein